MSKFVSLFAVPLILFAGCTSQTTISEDPPIPFGEPLPSTQTANADSTTPETFRVKFETTKGDFVVEVTSAWAPFGATRFHRLVKEGFYDGCGFFRVMPEFMVQFGINGDPQVQAQWRDAPIPDDPVTQSNKPGYVTFATSGPNSRTTQIFINYDDDNSRLDSQGFAPFGRVIEGMETVKAINCEYRELPDQNRIQSEGNAYLKKAFPNLDYVNKATILGSVEAEEQADTDVPTSPPGE